MAECSQLDFFPLLIRIMFFKKVEKKKQLLNVKLSQCPGAVTLPNEINLLKKIK